VVVAVLVKNCSAGLIPMIILRIASHMNYSK
jgi:hypothetical protein